MIRFSREGVSPVDMVSPIYGDSEIYDTNTTLHLSMLGGVYSYNKALRRTILLTFRGVTHSQYQAFLTFYLATDGLPIRYRDKSNYLWYGYIINEPLEATTVIGKGSCRMYNITIQMRVTGVSTPVPSEGIFLVDDESNYLVDDEGNYLVATA